MCHGQGRRRNGLLFEDKLNTVIYYVGQGSDELTADGLHSSTEIEHSDDFLQKRMEVTCDWLAFA
jgi:hypothetical protein